MENKFNVPTEVVDLPSKGLVYPKENPLSSGTIEMKYMTAREEDILTNQSYIQKGTVLDELALLVAARILGYGKDYTFMWGGEEQTVDLSTIENKVILDHLYNPGVNEFKFTLPSTKIDITFKLLTSADEKKINAELEGLKKIYKNNVPELSTRLKYMITSVEGNTENPHIREFVDKYLLARDSKALREYIREVQPDVDLTFFPEGSDTKVNIPVGLNFFWPDA